MANYTLSPEDKTIVSTQKAYNEIAASDGSTPWSQARAILAQYQLKGDQGADPFALDRYITDLSNYRETGLTNLANQYGIASRNLAGRYGSESGQLYSTYRQGVQDIRNPYIAARESDLYSAKNQAAAQYATRQKQITRSIKNQYAAAEREAQQSFYSDYTKQQETLVGQYANQQEELAKSYVESASSFATEVDKLVSAASTEKAAYQKNLLSLISTIFGIDANSVTWREDMMENGWLDADGNTTAYFDDALGDFLYGENFLENLRNLQMEDQDLAKFVSDYRFSLARNIGLDYDPTPSETGNTEMYRATARALNSPSNIHPPKGEDGLMDNENTYVDSSDGYGQEKRYLYKLDYADGSSVWLGDQIVASGKYDGTSQKMWRFIDQTPGENYKKTRTLKEGFENGVIYPGAKFTGENGKQYVVVYYNTNGGGKKDPTVVVREVVTQEESADVFAKREEKRLKNLEDKQKSGAQQFIEAAGNNPPVFWG